MRRGFDALPVLAVALALSVLGFAEPQDERILVFSKTAGFRHDSIGDGVAAFVELSERLGFSVTVSQDYDAFTDRYMARYAAVEETSGRLGARNQPEKYRYEATIATRIAAEAITSRLSQLRRESRRCSSLIVP